MERRTAHAGVYEAIVGKLIARELRPREHLVVARLAEELGVSPTPIRAAMERLVAEGLLEKRDHKGYFVANCAPSELGALKDARRIIEGNAAALMARAGNAEAIARLRRCYEEMERAVTRGDVSAYLWHEFCFHRHIIQGCGNRFLSGLGGATALGILGWINVNPWPSPDEDTSPGSPFWQQRRGSLARHEAILRAIEKGDPGGCTTGPPARHGRHQPAGGGGPAR